jgi:hypothetical protein
MPLWLVINSNMHTSRLSFRIEIFHIVVCMIRRFISFLGSMFAWCMCDRRAHDVVDISPGCAQSEFSGIFLSLISIRFDAELKEVPNEARPRVDVRLVTPRGPSASTLESLEKALQTVGRAIICAQFFASFSLSPLEIERAFQSVRLFETFYSSEINLLARAIETVHFNDKECIYRQGDPGDYYYLILKGRVNCQMQVCLRFVCLVITVTPSHRVPRHHKM